MKQRWLPILLIVAAAFVVYWPAFQNGFVWDDTALVLRDPFIRSWRLIPEGFRHFLFTDATASNFYRPLQRLTYTFDYALYAFQPWGYHVTNVVLHAGAAAMFFLFSRKLVGRFAPAKNATLVATFAALIWAVHPLHTSAVTYVAGRADLLAALFGFAGLYLALREKMAGASVCFLAAMLSKESGVFALLTWLLILCFQRRRVRDWLVVAVAIAGVYCALRFTSDKQAPPPTEPMRLAVRPILMARAWAEYAGLFLAPVNLHMERDVVVIDHGDMRATLEKARLREFQTLLGATLIVAFGIWMRWTKRNVPLAFLCLAAFLIAYLPISNLFPLNATVAEHWLYVPSAFLLVAAILALRTSRFAKAAFIGGTLWFGFLSARTFVRNYDWKDQRTFIERTIACGGNSARMWINLGSLESNEGRQEIAIAHFTSALKLAPDQPFALIGLANAFLRTHEYARAQELLEKAVKIPVVRAAAMQDLGLLEYQRKLSLDGLRAAAESEPENWELQRCYVVRLSDRGEIPTAIRVLRDVLQKQAYRAESWRMLGDLLARIDQRETARRCYERAADYDVHDEDSRRKLQAFRPGSG